MFGKILAGLRKERKLSQYDLAEKMNLSRGQIANYEQGKRQPDFDTLEKFADFFGVSTDLLLGRFKDITEQNLSGFKSNSVDIEKLDKDERDVAKRMAELREDLSSATGLLFDGEPMSDEAKESLLEAMEFGVRLAKKNNKKYIPNKYRDKED
ncbi:helix-turn-helix domain-containing protein [Lysinibacillus sp. NPDC097195]|uniref:helix-turn-helix domain-containing protein n=1 Tax=Lysinibacillus sp. NPDC097195 TaxID=3364141 RepID=UPI003808CEE8